MINNSDAPSREDVERSRLRQEEALPPQMGAPVMQREESRLESNFSRSDLNLSKHRSQTQFDGFSLRFEDLIIWMPGSNSIFKKAEEKDILRGVNAVIPKGSMTAIIGPSGSGKTTMMNYLAGRQNESQAFKCYCELYINGSKIDNVNRFKNIIGYVLQDDIMEPSLTPTQLFRYYAKLRGLDNVEEKVKDVVSLMSLERCANTIVGDSFQRGLSGGERKRTSIGIELVSDPNLLFLDEPTTGLDSFTALDVMRNLADLKERGITIVSTIHSPSKEILELFDQVLMLVDGKLVYDGSPHRLAGRIEKLGLSVPKTMEPIEYFMKIIDKNDLLVEFEKHGRDKGPNNELVQEEMDKRIAQLVSMQAHKTAQRMSLQREQSAKMEDLVQLAHSKNQKLNVLHQFDILFKNNFYVFMKDTFGVVTKSLMFWILTIIILLVFMRIGRIEEDTINALNNRAGVIFMIIVIFFFTAMNLTSTLFIPRKEIYLKDKQGRLYDDGPFFMATQLYNLPVYFVNVTLSVLVLFFGVQLSNEPRTNFLWWWAFTFVGAFIGGGSMGLIIGVLCERIQDIGQLGPVLVLPQMVVAGYFANVRTMTWPLYIYSFISSVRFNFQGLILTEFQNRERYVASCNRKEDVNGETVISKVPANEASRCDPSTVYDFKEDSMWLNLVIVIVLNLGFRILAYIIFKIKYRERNANIVVDKARIDKYSIRTRESSLVK